MEAVVLERVFEHHARTVAKLSAGGVLTPLPQPPSPFLLAWIAEASPMLEPEAAARLAEYYGQGCIEDWVQRFHYAPEPVFDLVRIDLRTARVPRLRAALDRLFEGTKRAGLASSQTWNASSGAELLEAAPRIVDLHPRAFFGCCQPMVSLWPPEQQAIEEAVAGGWALDDLLDVRFAGALMHELAHGPARPWSGGPGSWTANEAAAAFVNHGCRPEHVFADRPGEPVPGLRHAMVLSQAMADALGSDAVWRMALGGTDPTAEIGRRSGHALVAADWQLWGRVGRAGYVPAAIPSHERMLDWAKLFDVSRGDRGLLPALDAFEEADGVTADLAFRAPDLLTLAAEIPWPELEAWHADVSETHRAGVARAVESLFQVERLQPDLQAVPADPPGGALVLDVERCALFASPRADDPYQLASTWRFPPALCRVVHGRGLRRLVLRGCTSERRSDVTSRLLDLCEGSRSLAATTEVDVQGPTRQSVAMTTPVPVDPPGRQLHHTDVVVALGSCFASHIATRLATGLFEVHDNPFGFLYDALSVARGVRWVAGEDPLPDDLLFHAHGRWHSDWHHTDFSHSDRNVARTQMIGRLAAARVARGRRGTWLLTWGTAWVQERVDTGDVVANCHGLPGDAYRRRLLDVEEIVESYEGVLDALQTCPGVQVVLTVSPIRYVAQGHVENQRSKATLHLAATRLAERHEAVHYFPAYEIVLDELRDGRWYTGDLRHVSEEAADHVYERFLGAFVAPAGRRLARAVRDVTDDLVRAPRDPLRRRAAAKELLDRIEDFQRAPALPRPRMIDLAVRRVLEEAEAVLGGEPAA